MSSKVKWGGIAGLAAAALLIMSAILQLNRASPIPPPATSTSTWSSSLPTSQ